jgi:hypothetical protein
MQVTRAKELDFEDAEIIRQMFHLVKGRYADGAWHHFKSMLRYGKQLFLVECDFKLEAGVISIKNRDIQMMVKQ